MPNSLLSLFLLYSLCCNSCFLSHIGKYSSLQSGKSLLISLHVITFLLLHWCPCCSSSTFRQVPASGLLYFLLPLPVMLLLQKSSQFISFPLDLLIHYLVRPSLTTAFKVVVPLPLGCLLSFVLLFSIAFIISDTLDILFYFCLSPTTETQAP